MNGVAPSSQAQALVGVSWRQPRTARTLTDAPRLLSFSVNNGALASYVLFHMA